MLAPTLLLARSAVRLRTCAIPKRRQFTATSSSGIIAKALVYSQYGRPTEVLRLHSHPLPVLTPSTIHLRFLAAPINPADVNQIEGAYPIKPPFRMDQVNSEVPVAVGGNEGVAEVIAVGDEVSDVKVGDWVVTARSGFGTWRTHAVATPAEVEVIPREGLSLVQAATITVNSCTAYRMLKDFVNLGEGDFVIQNAANSSVGQVVIEIAKVLGIKTINIVRNRPNIAELTARLTAIGATHVLTDDELGKVTTKEKIKEWTGGEPILLGLNCVGGRDATELARYLGHNGYHVTYGAMSRQPLTLPASLFIFKNITFSGFWISHWTEMHSRAARAEMLRDITGMMRDGRVGEVAWEKVAWDTRGADADMQKRLREAVEKGISGFGTGKQVVVME